MGAFSMQPWAHIKVCACEKSNAMNVEYEFSQEDCFTGQSPNEHWLLHLFDTFLTSPRNDEEVAPLQGIVIGWFCLGCLILVFSINHIQYGLINLIGGQLLFPSAPFLNLGRRMTKWQLVKKVDEGLCVWGLLLCIFSQPGRGSLLTVLQVKSQRTSQRWIEKGKRQR